MGDFVADTLRGALAELEQRRRKIQPFLDEAGRLDLAVREHRRTLKRLGIDADGATPSAPPASAPPSPAAATAGPRKQAAITDPKPGTNADKILALLRSHPRGLNTTVIAREADVPMGSTGPVLNQLVDGGVVVKVGRGFWRAAGEPPFAPVADAAA